ncbi:EamA family transporter RarD [Streptococcus dentiloxodontae]
MTRTKKGLLFALGAYLSWAFISIYWKALSGVNSYNSFSYRILFTFITMFIYMLISKRKAVYQAELRMLWEDKKASCHMILASLFIAVNWLSYIYGVGHGQATEASLGYYIMPLVSVLLSVLVLKERLSRLTKLSVFLACAGVAVLVLLTAKVPLISLILAVSFAVYGLIKKNVQLSSDVAMLVEAGVIAPFALIYLFFFSGESFLSYTGIEMFLLVISGVVTAIPLLLFAEGVKRAPLNQVGFIQYINPTIQLFIAILLFGEGITSGELYGFVLIWLAVAVFIVDQLYQSASSNFQMLDLKQSAAFGTKS